MIHHRCIYYFITAPIDRLDYTDSCATIVGNEASVTLIYCCVHVDTGLVAVGRQKDHRSFWVQNVHVYYLVCSYLDEASHAASAAFSHGAYGFLNNQVHAEAQFQREDDKKDRHQTVSLGDDVTSLLALPRVPAGDYSDDFFPFRLLLFSFSELVF